MIEHLYVMGILSSFFIRGKKRITTGNHHPMSHILPSPSSLHSPERYKSVRQHVYTCLKQNLERGNETFEVYLTNDSHGTSFSKTKDLRPLTYGEHIALLADVRHELTVAGWHIESCGIVREKLVISVQPVQERTKIIAPEDLWPHITNPEEFLDIAKEDLIRCIEKELMIAAVNPENGGPTISFFVDVPGSYKHLDEDTRDTVIAAVRDEFSTNWTVNTLKAGSTTLSCVFQWRI